MINWLTITQPLHQCPLTPHQIMTALGQRTIQVRFTEERLRNGISPATVAGITALLAQLETHTTLPSMAVSIVTDVARYKPTMTCRNEVWDGFDLSHPLLDGRSTVVYGHRTQTTFEQEPTLRVPSSVPASQPLPPAHMVIQPQPHPQQFYSPNVQQLLPTLLSVAPNTQAPYASAPAAVHAPHMTSSSNSELASSTQRQVSSASVASAQSSAPPLT